MLFHRLSSGCQAVLLVTLTIMAGSDQELLSAKKAMASVQFFSYVIFSKLIHLLLTVCSVSCYFIYRWNMKHYLFVYR